MLELETALEEILSAIPPALAERVDLNQARGRVLVERISSPIDLPVFDNSAMDGYAVQANDVKGASSDAPVQLRLLGKVAAGAVFEGEVEAGGCVRLFTGSPLPRGADAVVMQENTRLDPAQPGAVFFLDSAKPWEYVRLRGEDVKCGAVLAEAGARLTAVQVSLLAAVGLTRVSVGRCPLAGLLATGSELREGGQPLSVGQIYESNRVGLAALLTQAGAIPKIFPLVPDTLGDTQAALETAFAECDVVVTSGGASVGEMDLVKNAFETLGGEMQFWKVAIKPGKPFVFGRRREKFLFGLPGNPVSALVTFLLLVRPALLRWQGANEVALPAHPGVLAEPLANPGDRRHFIRVNIDRTGQIRSAGVQASHALSSLSAANGLVDVPPQTTLPAGTIAQILRWESE